MGKSLAYYHLPGLFEFRSLYEIFLPLYFSHREYFYEWCQIGSIYGAPADCLWGGGRVGFGEDQPSKVLELAERFSIPARLTFSNSLIREEHLNDRSCNELCTLFEKADNGIIIHSDLLLKHIRSHYPSYQFISSTTKVLTDFEELKTELRNPDFSYVVPDFRLNKHFAELETLTQDEKDKLEFLCNECCSFSCTARRQCYENVSRKALGEDVLDHICPNAIDGRGYRFSKAMENPGFISIEDIQNRYLPMGFSQFKLEGRSLGSAMVLEFLLYYMTKPEYQLKVREEIYLDSMLDLF